MKSPTVATAVTVLFSTWDSARFWFASRAASKSPTGRQAVFSPGAHSTSVGSFCKVSRTPRDPLGVEMKRPAGRLGKNWFNPLQDRPPSTERHTPLALATTTSSGSRGAVAKSVKPPPRMETPLYAVRFDHEVPPSSDRKALCPIPYSLPASAVWD